MISARRLGKRFGEKPVLRGVDLDVPDGGFALVTGVTVTVKEQVAPWPQLSLAVQVTVDVPTGKVLPEGGLQTTESALHPP